MDPSLHIGPPRSRRRRRRRSSASAFRSAASSIRTTEQLVHSAPSSGEGREDPAKDGAGIAGDPSVEGSEEEKKDGGPAASDFECTICLQVAKKPVVTCCGHLFCWPCLYRWLHLHCSRRECPVCKGEVDESGITPIYGRGRSEAASEEHEGDAGGGAGSRVPPAPRGRRVEMGHGPTISAWQTYMDERLANLESTVDRLVARWDAEAVRIENRLQEMQRNLDHMNMDFTRMRSGFQDVHNFLSPFQRGQQHSNLATTDPEAPPSPSNARNAVAPAIPPAQASPPRQWSPWPEPDSSGTPVGLPPPRPWSPWE